MSYASDRFSCLRCDSSHLIWYDRYWRLFITVCDRTWLNQWLISLGLALHQLGDTHCKKDPCLIWGKKRKVCICDADVWDLTYLWHTYLSITEAAIHVCEWSEWFIGKSFFIYNSVTNILDKVRYLIT